MLSGFGVGQSRWVLVYIQRLHFLPVLGPLPWYFLPGIAPKTPPQPRPSAMPCSQIQQTQRSSLALPLTSTQCEHLLSASTLPACLGFQDPKLF